MRQLIALTFLAAAIVIGSQNAQQLHNQAAAELQRGDLTTAERLFNEAVAAWDETPEGRTGAAKSKTGLATICRATGRYAEAEQLYKEVLVGVDSESAVAGSALSSYAELYVTTGRAAQAEPLAKRALAILDNQITQRASALHTLARIDNALGRRDAALKHYQQSLTLLEAAYGPNDPSLAPDLIDLSAMATASRDYPQAESKARRAVQILEKSTSRNNPKLGIALNNLAQSLRLQRRYNDAEPFYVRAVTVLDGTPDQVKALSNFAGFYHDQGREPKAAEQYRRALDAAAPRSAEAAQLMTRLADVYRAQRKYQAALALYRESLAISNSAETRTSYDLLRREASFYLVSAR